MLLLFSCSKSDSPVVPPSTTVSDIDGHNYALVTIGTQCWTQTNLNVSKYRNGDVIPQVNDAAQWASLTTGAWCYYQYNSANGTDYGKLYNWYAVHDARGLAPTGYHVPSDAEWNTLIWFLGGEGVAGTKMKATTLWTWSDPIYGPLATNSSGFTAFPGGYCNYNGSFNTISQFAYWWSSSESSTAEAWCRTVSYSNFVANRDYHYKTRGFSVRCLRD